VNHIVTVADVLRFVVGLLGAVLILVGAVIAFAGGMSATDALAEAVRQPLGRCRHAAGESLRMGRVWRPGGSTAPHFRRRPAADESDLSGMRKIPLKQRG
jgi:hypothetical protein